MNFETNRYEEFLVQLCQLQFCTVQNVLRKREDLSSFIAKDGRKTTSRDPWFGACYDELTEAEETRAELKYSYYCGHADDVFYRKPTQSGKRECFMPAPSSLLSKQTLPTVGEIIFGHTEEDDRGEGKRRFIWWNF